MQIAALLLSAAFAAQAAPVATTGDEESVTTGSAVVNGTVDPNGEATRYWVEYGTSSAYGVKSSEQVTGTGADPVDVKVPLTGLTRSTTYHYRVVAENASGQSAGVDRSLRTASPAAAPSISSRSTTGVSATGATVGANVNPRSLATTVRFEYGTSTSYGSATPDQAIGAGATAVAVTAAITGLKPGTRYNFRTVATSAAGIARSGNRTFTTSKAPTGVAITPSTIRPVWGSGMTVTGSVSGAASLPVALEKQEFPFTGAFVQIATANANSGGSFSLTAPPLFVTSRLRVVTRTSVVATSPVATVSVAVKVGLKTRRLAGRRTRIEGATWPAVPAGRVSLQRQSRSGKWIYVKRARISALTGGRSRYTFSAVARRSRAMNYRVVVLARNGGANVPGTSRTITIAKR
jgi:hypothetical protein